MAWMHIAMLPVLASVLAYVGLLGRRGFLNWRKQRSDDPMLQTQGIVMNWGWRYDLLLWFFDTFMLRGALMKSRFTCADLAQLKAGESVLDVGCGTGTLAIIAKERVGVTGHVCGIDPGEKQIARARYKAARRGLSLQFQRGVMEHLPFPDESFDVVFITSVIHHGPGEEFKRQGLKEMTRVLKPRGRLVVVDSGMYLVLPLIEELGFSSIETGEVIHQPRGRQIDYALGRKPDAV